MIIKVPCGDREIGVHVSDDAPPETVEEVTEVATVLAGEIARLETTVEQLKGAVLSQEKGVVTEIAETIALRDGEGNLTGTIVVKRKPT